jgi:iron complex outermembrane receptor protein
MNVMNPQASATPQPTSANSNAVCKLCTIRLERLCYQRARWFRAFRAVLAGAVRVWSLFHPVAPDLYLCRSKECHACIRFRKNVLKEESRIFRWLDGYINPLFNRARDSLLTPQEMNAAREHAKRAGSHMAIGILVAFGLCWTSTHSAWAQDGGGLGEANDGGIPGEQLAPERDGGGGDSADVQIEQAVQASGNVPSQQVEDGVVPEGANCDVVITATRPGSEGSAAAGYKNTTASVGPLGKMPLQDIPYSIHVTSSELFENRDAHTVFSALTTDPMVSSLMESSGYSSMSRVMVRGFTAADQDFRDGLVDRSFTFVPLENVERIEVLNGLSSFIYGFSSLGGSLNYVSKQPTTTPFASVAVGQYGGGINYVHGDSGGHLGADGRWGYRVNLYQEDGSTYIKSSTQERTLLSGVVTFKVSSGTDLHADIWHQELDMHGLQTYLNVNPANGILVPSASGFNAETQYGQDWTYNKSRKTLMGIGLDSKLNEIVTLRTAYRYGEMWRSYQYVAGTLTDNLGNYSEKAVGSTRQTEVTHSAYALLDADFKTNIVRHKLTFGYTGTDFLYTRGDDVSSVLGVSSVDSPTTYADPGLVLGPTNVWYQQYYRNWVAGYRMQLGEFLSLLANVNRAEIQQKRWGNGTALATPEYTQHKLTPSYALTFKPLPIVTTYFSYAQGLVNGGQAPSTAANANALLGPSVSDQYEAGAKARLGKMDVTAALFRINKINEYLDPSDNVYKQDGREIHKGIELSVVGKVVARLTLVGGFTLLNAEVTKAANNPALVGKIPVNVPERQARLYAEYILPYVSDLTLVGGANYSGRRPVDAVNTDYLDGATTYDAGIRYQTEVAKQKLVLNLNVSNLLNTAYWTYYRSGDGLLLGSPRIVSFTAKASWQ